MFMYFLVCNRTAENVDAGVERGTAVVQEIRPGRAGFKTSDFVEEIVGALP